MGEGQCPRFCVKTLFRNYSFLPEQSVVCVLASAPIKRNANYLLLISLASLAPGSEADPARAVLACWCLQPLVLFTSVCGTFSLSPVTAFMS